MDFNATLFGQIIAMIVFVWFCMKYIWPVIMTAIEQRQTEIANGLAAAEKGQSSLATAKVEVMFIIGISSSSDLRLHPQNIGARASAQWKIACVALPVVRVALSNVTRVQRDGVPR